jgi:DNA-binding beta-propeller fold protein YncE
MRFLAPAFALCLVCAGLAAGTGFRLLAHLPLPQGGGAWGAPGIAVSDGKGLLWACLEGQNQVLKIDAKKGEILARWDAAPGEGPATLCLDAKHHRLFVGCRNRMAVVLDSDSGRFAARLPIGADVGGSAYDPVTRLVFHSCGDGTFSVVHEDAPDEYSVIGAFPTEKGAGAMALDLKSHRVYLPCAGSLLVFGRE